MTYDPTTRNFSGVGRLTYEDFQAIHTAMSDARRGLGDSCEALRDLQHGLNQPQDWLKKRAARALMGELAAKEVALDKALRGDDGIETEIGVLHELARQVQEPTYARVDLLAAIESQAKKKSLFDSERNPHAARQRFAEAILASLDRE